MRSQETEGKEAALIKLTWMNLISLAVATLRVPSQSPTSLTNPIPAKIQPDPSLAALDAVLHGDPRLDGSEIIDEILIASTSDGRIMMTLTSVDLIRARVGISTVVSSLTLTLCGSPILRTTLHAAIPRLILQPMHLATLGHLTLVPVHVLGSY